MTMKDRGLSGDLLDGRTIYRLREVCQACGVHAEDIVEMVDEGVIEVTGTDVRQWRFTGSSVVRIRTVLRLQRDLRVNLAGAALALTLLDEVDALRAKLARNERRHDRFR
jgi:chaperone modulatory protein CbpM